MAEQKATNVTWHDGEVTRADRCKPFRSEGCYFMVYRPFW